MISGRCSFSVVALSCAIVGLAVTSPSLWAQNYQGPIIDAHAHIRFNESDGLSPTQPIGTAALEKLDDAAGVSESALIVIARKGEIEQTRAQSDAVLKADADSHGRFYPVVSVHPADGDLALAELERISKAGAKEVKLHPNTQQFDVSDSSVAAVVQKCGDLGLVVLFDSYKPWDPAEIGKFVLLAAQHPTTKIVLAHMGFSGFREILTFAELGKLGMLKNVFFDVSAIAVAYVDSPVQPELVWTIRKVGTDRFLFGSDWPVDTPADAVSAVRRLGFTIPEQQQIFHDNVSHLLGLEDHTKSKK